MQEETVRLLVVDGGGRCREMSTPAPGEILVAELRRGGRAELLPHLEKLRRGLPWSPLVLAASKELDADMLIVASIAADVGARAMLPNANADWAALIERVNRIDDLPLQFARWISFQRRDVGRLLERIETLVQFGLDGKDLQEAADACSVTPRNLEDSFKRHTLAAPGKYLLFSRLMNGITAIRKPDRRLDDAAHLAGYSSATAFMRALRVTLTADLHQLRLRVGFEWVAHAMGLAHRSNTERKHKAK